MSQHRPMGVYRDPTPEELAACPECVHVRVSTGTKHTAEGKIISCSEIPKDSSYPEIPDSSDQSGDATEMIAQIAERPAVFGLLAQIRELPDEDIAVIAEEIRERLAK